MGFSRQEYWSELLFPSLGDLPDPEIGPASPALASGLFTAEPPGKPTTLIYSHHICSFSTSAIPNLFGTRDRLRRR